MPLQRQAVTGRTTETIGEIPEYPLENPGLVARIVMMFRWAAGVPSIGALSMQRACGKDQPGRQLY
jgi:hypothetical protein